MIKQTLSAALVALTLSACNGAAGTAAGGGTTTNGTSGGGSLSITAEAGSNVTTAVPAMIFGLVNDQVAGSGIFTFYSKDNSWSLGGMTGTMTEGKTLTVVSAVQSGSTDQVNLYFFDGPTPQKGWVATSGTASIEKFGTILNGGAQLKLNNVKFEPAPGNQSNGATGSFTANGTVTSAKPQ